MFCFFFFFERTVQLTINYTQSSLCLCCYNYQSFYVLGLSCSSLEEYFCFDAQLLVSHRSCLKKPDLISNAVVSYKKAIPATIFCVSSEGTYETFQSVGVLHNIFSSLSNPLNVYFCSAMDLLHTVAPLKEHALEFF